MTNYNWLKFGLTAIILIFQLLQSTNGTDWMFTCDPCHCQWNSGKKTSDCKSKQLTAVPQSLSNELQVIDLSQNSIHALKREEFIRANLNNLHKIYMRNCSTHKLDREALKGLSILIELDFSNNFISVLEPGTFEGLSKLRNLLMNNNQIEILPNFLFAGLEYLARVEFKNNRLKTVEFGSLPMLSAVYLDNNQLSLLHKETFAYTPKLLHLSLASNPWNCSCDLKDFRDYTISSRLYTPPTACAAPPHLRDKKWTDIPSESFACKPRILGPMYNFVEAHTHNATFNCEIESTPRPNVSWLFNKRPLNTNDYRFKISYANEPERRYFQTTNTITAVLHISDLRPSDIGTYTCIVENNAGRVEADFKLLINNDEGFYNFEDKTISTKVSSVYTNFWFVVCLIITILLFLLIIAVLFIFWYCRRMKTYQKNTIITNEELAKGKTNKSECSILEGGSVIREMQKSLLTEVNPVEKPPRRTDVDSMPGENEELHDMHKSLLDEKSFIFCRSLQDDDGNGSAVQYLQPGHHSLIENSLPPDLLAFPAHRPTNSPSMKSSISNLPEHVIYGVGNVSSPITSPVMTHMSAQHAIYDSALPNSTPNGYMTLQHPKSRNLMATSERKSRSQKPQQQQQHQQSPFMPAPVLYSPTSALIIKQGYMTIPRKPRASNWAIPNSKNYNQMQMTGSPNPSECGTISNMGYLIEPVYDNLGVRTTAGGNSTLNLNKSNSLADTVVQYKMRHRPLPATPNVSVMATKNDNLYEKEQNDDFTMNSETASLPPYSSTQSNQSKSFDTIPEQMKQQQQQQQQQQKQHHQKTSNDMLYSSNENNSIISNNGGEVLYKINKIPPRPPPKPKKKTGLGSTIKVPANSSQIFDDEGEDGTEV